MSQDKSLRKSHKSSRSQRGHKSSKSSKSKSGRSSRDVAKSSRKSSRGSKRSSREHKSSKRRSGDSKRQKSGGKSDRTSGTKSNSKSSERKSTKSKRSSKSKKSGRGGEKRGNSITLVHSSGRRRLPIQDFVLVSKLIKQQQSTNSLPSSIDMKQYHEVTVKSFADYVEKKKLKTQLSFFALAELLNLAKTFVMDGLQNRLEEILVMSAEKSPEFLLEAICVVGTGTVSRETETRFTTYLGPWSFLNLANLPTFQNIPYHQFMQMLSSCELNVPHEMAVVDAALLWLVGQPHPTLVGPAIVAMLRCGYLNKVEKQMCLERMQTLALPDSLCRLARKLFESRHNARVCLEQEHIKRHMARCGLVEEKPSRSEDASLPLSRPRPGITWAEKAKTLSKKTAKKSSKSKRSSKSKSKRRSSSKKPSAGGSSKRNGKSSRGESHRKGSSKRGNAKKKVKEASSPIDKAKKLFDDVVDKVTGSGSGTPKKEAGKSSRHGGSSKKSSKSSRKSSRHSSKSSRRASRA